MEREDIDKFYKDYFRNKFAEFGDTPKGVDWKDEDVQSGSFRYIMETIRFYYPALTAFSVLEVGCGYGAFYEFLRMAKPEVHVDYFGIDLVEEMIAEAAAKYPENRNNFFVGDFKTFQFQRGFDFITSSGIFNLKQHIDEAAFEKHILHTIEMMFQQAGKGAVINLMTPAPDFKDPRLFYPSLDLFFSFIYKNLSRKVMILSSYPLWKITVGIFK
jgi:SAM-dependent methyltransferase